MNNRVVNDLNAVLLPEHLASETVIVLRRGKSNFALLRFVG